MVESAAAAQPRTDRSFARRPRPSVLPVPLFLVLLALVHEWTHPAVFFDPPWLVLLANIVFLGGVGAVIVIAAARNFLATGRIQILLLGCSALLFGLGALFAAMVRGLSDGANLNVTIYNTAALLASVAHAIAAFILLVGLSPETSAARRRSWLVAVYAVTVVLPLVVTAASLAGVLPPYFVQGAGPTILRQHVLGAADVLFAVSLVIFSGAYLRTRDEFLYWYATGLALTAISLSAFMLQRSVGSPEGWVGRASQYLGAVYFVMAIVKAARTAQSRRTSLGNVMTTALSGAEEKFRALAENAPDPIRRFDPELRHVYVNFAGQRLYGKTASAIVGKRIQDLGVPAARSAAWEERIRKVFEAGEPTEIEEYVQTGEGTRFLQSRCVPEYGHAGRVAYVLVVSRDLTGRKEAEEALRRSEEQYRSLFSTMTEGFALLHVTAGEPGVHSSDWRFLAINPAFERLTGLRREDLLGNTIGQVLPEEALGWAAHFGRVAETGDPAQFERWAPMLRRQYEVYAFRSGPMQVAILFRDVTARRAAEQALELAKAAAEESNRQKDHFLAVLSHELRNPLTPIRNSAYILQRAAPGSDQARRAQAVIDRQATQLSRLVDDLLDVTRMTRNKIQLRRERVELNELVRRAVEDERSLFDDAGVRLEHRAADQRVYLDADSSRLTQVVSNLLQNAAKFTPRGGAARVSIDVDENRAQAVVRVRDDGVGMAPDMVARLFQPFAQADVTLDRSKGGLGLGLALVKGLVELHGGEVSARSEGLGMGSELVVRLPLADREPTPRPAVGDVAPVRRRRVLVIEDNLDAAESLRDALELGGHEVLLAHTGREGVARALASVPDVVLCDLGLPEMDGYEVARALRADDSLAGTFLVALSGYTMPADLQRAAEAGFQRHLAKPATLEVLEALLAAVSPGNAARFRVRGSSA